MSAEVKMACELYMHLAKLFERGPLKMGDSFEEWLFWNIPSRDHFRSSREGVARVSLPVKVTAMVESVLWQSLLEHPDFVVERNDSILGIECKSLESSQSFLANRTGTPCRTTVDFNSTVPCGQENFKGKFDRYAGLRGKPLRMFYAMALYGKIDDEDHIASLLVVDGNYLNRDYKLHEEHRNVSRSGFGSYGDGRIRDRKMYIFPNPMTDDDLKGTFSLVTEEANLDRHFDTLRHVLTKVKRTIDGHDFQFNVYQLGS